MELAALFAPHVFFGQRGVALPYRLLGPSAQPPGGKGRLPLVLFLHGAGERGDDNAAQLENGAARLLGSPLARRDFPCHFVLPQCPKGSRWVEVDWSSRQHSLPAAPSVPLGLTLELLAALFSELPVDRDRVYLVGLSMGGYGAWDLLSRAPETFAAAVIVCGGGDEAQAARLAGVPIWAFHGAEDKVVPVERSRRMIAALRGAAAGTDPPPRYTEYAGVGHDAWTTAFREPELLPWLFSQRRGLPKRP